MKNHHFRIVLLALLAAGIVLTAASSAWADGCEGGSCTGFEKGEYEVAEAAGYVDLAVFQAWCCPMGQGQIDYHTSDLTALAGEDYQQTSGTLTFAAPANSFGRLEIRVPINQDELLEGEQRFEVRLTNFRGTFVNRGRETAVVRILDDDSKQASGGSAISGQSKQQTAGSQPRSSSGPPSTSAVPTSPGPSAAGDEPGEVNADDLSRSSEHVVSDEAEPIVGRAERNGEPPSSLLPTAVGTLVVVGIAAVELGLKKRVRRRFSANP